MQGLAGGVQSTRPTTVTQGSYNSHENLFSQGELPRQAVNSTLLAMLEQLPKALLSQGKRQSCYAIVLVRVRRGSHCTGLIHDPMRECGKKELRAASL